MTEWNKSKKRNRNNGPLSRTNLSATQAVHSTTSGIYTNTHPGVRVPPSLWHDSWSPSPPSRNRQSWLKERVIGGSVGQTVGGSRRGEWGSVMLPERLPLPLCLLAGSHHPSPIAHSTAQALKTPTVPPLCCPQAKVCSSFYLHPIRKSLMGWMPLIQPSDERCKRQTAAQRRGEKKKCSQAGSAVSASAEGQHCTVLCLSWLLQEGGWFRPRQRCWVLKPANVLLNIDCYYSRTCPHY